MEETIIITNEKPKSYLVLAIISTFFFWPLGIVAIIKALKVDDYFAMKNYEMAYYTSKDAKKFGIIGLIIGLIGYISIALIAIFVIVVANIVV